jgi:predicted oxidoreductase
MKLILQIAVGILLAFSVMGLGFMAFTAYLEHEAKLQVQEALMEIKAKQAIQLRNVQLSKQEKIKQRKQEIIAAQNKRQQSIKQAENEKLKNEAWLKIYRPRPDCETYTSDEHMVECVEYRSEQRRKFEAAYRKLNIN